MKLIYTAGRYRAKSDEEKWRNILRARIAARKLWMEGWAVICPHQNTAWMDGRKTEDIFLKGDLEILKRCDAIYMLRGYERSAGAKEELKLAKKLKKKIIYEN